MFIEKIHQDDIDEITGTRINSIKTKKGNIQTPLRGANNSYCNAFKKDKECRNKPFPTPWVELSNKIPTPEKMKELIDELGSKSDKLMSLNAPFRKNCIIEYSPVINNSIKYDKNIKEKITSFLNLGINSKADIISIPDFNEKPVRFKDKILFAEKLLLSHPEEKNHEIMPYIRSDSRKFEDKLNILTTEGFNLIGIDYHGYSGVCKTNFNRLQNFARDLNRDIIVKIGHTKRKINNTNASTPHLMFYFGADIVTERVNNIPKHLYDYEKKKMPPRDIDSVSYFNPSNLGIIKKEDLPDFYGVECNCPYHRNERYNKESNFFIQDGDMMGQRSKICELYSGNMECERSKPSIVEDSYLEYLRNKKCIRNTLDLNFTPLNSFY